MAFSASPLFHSILSPSPASVFAQNHQSPLVSPVMPVTVIFMEVAFSGISLAFFTSFSSSSKVIATPVVPVSSVFTSLSSSLPLLQEVTPPLYQCQRSDHCHKIKSLLKFLFHNLPPKLWKVKSHRH